MNIFISVDIEGVAGVNEGLQGQRGNLEYEVARNLMTQEANAAIQGAFDGGAEKVTVADSHGPMRNMIADKLDPRARLISGKPRPLSMIEGVTDKFDGVVLIGFHAAAGNFGVLSHTISGLAFSRIEINGVRAGEPLLFAGHAAEIGVPLLAVSGDDCLAREITSQFPASRSITVKRAIGAVASDSLSPEKSCKMIKAQVQKAVSEASSFEVCMPCDPPLVVDIVFKHQRQADAADLLPFVTRADALSVRFEEVSYRDAIGSLSALALIARAVMET